MIQFVALATAFACLFLLLRRKIDFGVSICTSAAVLGLITSGPLQFLIKAAGMLTRRSALETMAAVVLIGVLSGACRHYGILDKIVHNLKLLVNNPRIILMAVPGIIGLLPVIGGAAMSVPFVDTIADEYGVSQERKGVINLVFRHAGMLLMPFSTAVIAALAVLSQNNVTYGELASRTAFFVVGNMLLGYILFLRGIPAKQPSPPEGDRKEAAKELFINLSPILSVVAVTFIFNTPIYIGVGIGICMVFFISDKKDFIKVLLRAANPKMMIIIAGITMMQGFIQELNEVIRVLTGSLGTGVGALAAYTLTAAFLALITGLSLTPLGIVLPLVAAMPQSHAMLLANTYLVFAFSYLGYYFSPMHLCQVLTVEYLHCTTQELLKEYRVYAAGLFCVAVAGYMLFVAMA